MKKYNNNNVGAIWNRTAKSWLTYKSWILNVNWIDYNIAMFDNDQKGNDKAPNFKLKVTPIEDKPTQNTSDEIDMDSIPF